MIALNELDSLTKKRKRVGRGGSRGGTSGKGHKGQKARSGPKIGIIFEGGQMPLTRRLPKRGFNNTVFRTVFEIVNLDQLEGCFQDGEKVDKLTLIDKGLIKGIKKASLKILGNGKLTKKLSVFADAFSDSAKDAITNKGGEVNITKER